MSFSHYSWFISNPQHTVIFELKNDKAEYLYLAKPPGEFREGITQLFLSKNKKALEQELSPMDNGSSLQVNNYEVDADEMRKITNYPNLVDLTKSPKKSIRINSIFQVFKHRKP